MPTGRPTHRHSKQVEQDVSNKRKSFGFYLKATHRPENGTRVTVVRYLVWQYNVNVAYTLVTPLSPTLVKRGRIERHFSAYRYGYGTSQHISNRILFCRSTRMSNRCSTRIERAPPNGISVQKSWDYLLDSIERWRLRWPYSPGRWSSESSLRGSSWFARPAILTRRRERAGPWNRVRENRRKSRADVQRRNVLPMPTEKGMAARETQTQKKTPKPSDGRSQTSTAGRVNGGAQTRLRYGVRQSVSKKKKYRNQPKRIERRIADGKHEAGWAKNASREADQKYLRVNGLCWRTDDVPFCYDRDTDFFTTRSRIYIPCNQE